MRIVSLLPAGTEIVCALGAADQLVAISHECDWPAELHHLPRVTTTPISRELSGLAIDCEVRRLRAEGRPVIAVDGSAMRRLAPDLVITQNLCEVCAIADGEVQRLAAAFEPAPRVLSLTANDLDGIRRDIVAVGEALEQPGRALALVARLVSRLHEISLDHPAERPRVVCIEWLDPLFLAGHWVPEMVELAGGRDVGAMPGSHSVQADWSSLLELEPDLAIVMLCGFPLDRALQEIEALADDHPLTKLRCPVWVMDGNAFTSRAGPRVVEGTTVIQSAIQGLATSGLVEWKRHPHTTPT